MICTGGEDWHDHLSKLAVPYGFIEEGIVKWEGDLMSRKTPIWMGTVLVMNRQGQVSVANRADSRKFAHAIVREVTEIE